MTNGNFQLNLQTLPSPPAVALSLLELFNDPDVCLDEVAKVIRVDPALSAKIINYCNSPLMGLPKKADSLDRAIIVLGMNVVRMISLSFSLVEIKDEENETIDFDHFWSRSLAIAVSVQTVCRQMNQDADLGFLIGLMANIGEIAIYRKTDRLFYEEIRKQHQRIESIVPFEHEQFQTDRFTVGGKVLEQWQFPPEISNQIVGLCESSEQCNELERSLRCGWDLATLFLNDDPSVEFIEATKQRIMASQEIETEELDAIFQEAQEGWLEYSSLLNLDNEWNLRTLRELEGEAKSKMTAFSIIQTQDQRRVMEENVALRSSASKDSLTGTNNRRAFDEQGEQSLSRCQRMERPFSLIIVDIDHFKKFNDDHGHQCGDEVLVHVSNTLIGSLRDYDSLYRYGGEEFVITLPECDREKSARVGERLRSAVAQNPLVVDSKELSVTVSVGIATFENPNTGSLDELFAKADACMYKAKTLGRNCCVACGDSEVPVTLSNPSFADLGN